jgi:hypothetical protein
MEIAPTMTAGTMRKRESFSKLMLSVSLTVLLLVQTKPASSAFDEPIAGMRGSAQFCPCFLSFMQRSSEFINPQELIRL